MQNTTIKSGSAGLRKECPDCHRYFTAQLNADGDYVGKCPFCGSWYFEQFRKNEHFIKTVRKNTCDSPDIPFLVRQSHV